MKPLTRRDFAVTAASALMTKVVAQPAPVTAEQVVERIKKNVGVPWRDQTVDVFKAGDPETPLTGIATTFMSTLSMLQRAAENRKNFIITHEPTFYNHLDKTDDLRDDPVYQYKTEFIRKHNLVVWRFHDHWHARKPDGIFKGFTKTLGWEKYETAPGTSVFTIPARPLADVAREVQERLKTRSLRVVGDPALVVSKIGRGGHDLASTIRTLADHDAIIAGDVREWDSPVYVRDAVLAGQKKALIVIAHERWEEFGMENCAEWVRSFVPEVPVEYMPSGEPFWNPLV
jgi:putative NIF3 family GTP cyclohydrolase 1 type 2